MHLSCTVPIFSVHRLVSFGLTVFPGPHVLSPDVRAFSFFGVVVGGNKKRRIRSVFCLAMEFLSVPGSKLTQQTSCLMADTVIPLAQP